ncbi:MAG: S-adenosylmethionine:tRNA ribosyltransferase-isomerase [Bacteroidia bacterium]|nr:S-adenosylmethionine:tRNA ribosyltransferase-isomerase [Bacteroidia bacterium]
MLQEVILTKDFDYDLPDSSIAKFPNPERDSSKLLVVLGEKIQDDVFKNIASYLPKNALFVLNDSRVFPARIHLQRDTGGVIEILLVRALPENRWLALAKNSKRWKINETITKHFSEGLFQVTLKNIHNTEIEVALYWEPISWTLEQVLQTVGEVPLPPYLHRKTTDIDFARYQTVYAHSIGSSAAPTAGLHFTPDLIARLSDCGYQFERLTLHVGPGTFLPVKTQTLNQHEMHTEFCSISIRCLKKLSQFSPIVAVGTTTLRTLESFYRAALPLVFNATEPLTVIPQFSDYQYDEKKSPSYQLVFEALLAYLIQKKLQDFTIQTKLMLVPGMQVHTADYLITNFHQPQSTLLALVEAFAGKIWNPAYKYALNQGYRFLSYGDACLFSQKMKSE